MRTYALLLKYVLLALPLACVSLFSSCSEDDERDSYVSGGPVTVRLCVSAGTLGDLNGTRAGGDANADEREFINTLKVYIVNNTTGITVEDLSPDLTADGLAQTGDMTEWHSAPITLDPGKYTVYAFANVEKYDGEYGAAGTEATGESMLQNCFKVGEQFKKDDLNSYRIDDPAGRIDLENGMYIPMSGVSEELVLGDLNAGGNDGFTVYLDRLVSKVNMTVGADLPGNITEQASVTFDGYSEKVPLMKASETSTHGTSKGLTMPLSDATQTADGHRLSFYVNETPAGDGFTVTLNTGNTSSGSISEYRAVTNRKELPRNSVYPLGLTFPAYSPVFSWKSWEAHIGEVPIEVVVEEENYIVNIAAGNTFEFAVTGIDGQENVTLGNVEWTHGDVSTQITGITNEGATLSGAVSAGLSPGVQIPLTVTIEWAGDVSVDGHTQNRNFKRTYNVIINIISMWDTKPLSETRNFKGTVYHFAPEVLNMFKLK